MREIFRTVSTERSLIVFIGSILFLTFLGPFGSYEALSLAERFIFWATTISCVAVPMHLTLHLALGSPWLATVPRIGRIAIGAGIAAIPGTGLVLFSLAVLWTAAFNVERVLETWLQVSVLGFAIGCLHYLRPGDLQTTAVIDPEVPEAGPPVRHHTGMTRFHARLDPATGSDIVSLSMQDHYVEVTTTIASQLVLIRFSDALTELQGVNGLRVHRSHWIALAHAAGLAREQGKWRVLLTDGRSLPVSQTYLSALRARVAPQDGVSAV